MTQLGELMVEFPLHPGLTRAVLKAASLGCQDKLLPVAAMLSVENIFIRPGQQFTFTFFFVESLKLNLIVIKLVIKDSE